MRKRDCPASSDAGRVVWGTGAQEPDSGLLQMRAPFPTVHLSLPNFALFAKAIRPARKRTQIFPCIPLDKWMCRGYNNTCSAVVAELAYAHV